MTAMLAWAIVLLLLGLGLVVLEFFVPSHGLIGTLAGICLVCAIVLAFLCGRWIGAGFVATVLVALPVAVGAAIKYWPDTTMGRRILLEVPSGDEVLPDDDHRRELRNLVGKVGRAKSRMLPCGAAEIDGRTYDALSEGMSIEPGETIEVVEVRGNRVVVRLAADLAPAQGARDGEGDLARPIDSIGLNPFEDPLA